MFMMLERSFERTRKFGSKVSGLSIYLSIHLSIDRTID